MHDSRVYCIRLQHFFYVPCSEADTWPRNNETGCHKIQKFMKLCVCSIVENYVMIVFILKRLHIIFTSRPKPKGTDTLKGSKTKQSKFQFLCDFIPYA